jgi:hypothetical protein
MGTDGLCPFLRGDRLPLFGGHWSSRGRNELIFGREKQVVWGCFDFYRRPLPDQSGRLAAVYFEISSACSGVSLDFFAIFSIHTSQSALE